MHIQLSSKLLLLRDLLDNHFPDNQTYIVGGAIRDTLQNKKAKDYDIATSVPPREILKLNNTYITRNPSRGTNWTTYQRTPLKKSKISWSKMVYTVRVICLSVQHGINKILITDDIGRIEEFEVATLREDVYCDGRHARVEFDNVDIELDLARRDLTINAMAVKLGGCKLVDPYNGQADLEAGIIKTVRDPHQRFQEDFLRIIRACRFAGCDSHFKIEAETLQAMRELAHNIPHYVSHERLRDELFKILRTPKPSICFNIMKDTNILQYFCTPLYNCIGVEQNQHHAETVYEHCLAVCDFLSPENPVLRLAGLLHDIGKPDVKQGEGLHSTFHNHELVGTKIAYDYVRRYLKCSKEDSEYITLMVRHHMFHFEDSTKRSTIKKWLQKIDGKWNDLFLLRMADRAGNKTKVNKPLVTHFMKKLLEEINYIETYEEPMHIADLAISGRDLVDMNYKPGPFFGEVLRELLERVLDEPSLNEHDVLAKLAKKAMEQKLRENFT